MRAAHCAALLAAVAGVQVQMVLALLSKKTASWFAAGARYGPEGEGVVVWVTRGAVTPASKWSIVLQLGRCPETWPRWFWTWPFLIGVWQRVGSWGFRTS